MATDMTKEEILAWIARELQARTFKTGSRGYGAYGKAEIDGKRYQISVNAVEIGSGKR
jgi:hypothetical protein